jgi:hypothetical protein
MAGAVTESLLAGFQASVLWLGVVIVLAFAGAAIVANLRRAARTAKRRLRGHVVGVLGVLCALATLYGGRKGYVVVSDPYIQDAGSYLTNDVAHVAISKRSQLLPDDTEILVYARQLDLTNATDWVRLEPHLTLAEHLLVEGVYFYDYALANATNYNVLVAANFTPAPTVHTNGVWQIKGFTIPGTGKAAFPNTRTIRKDEQ